MSALIPIPSVAHVGTMNPDDRTPRESLEAMMLSVSVDPDEWRSIARCGGAPEWTLSNPDAKYLDAHSLTDAEEAEIAEWAIARGYAEMADIWRCWTYDSESDDWSYFTFLSEKEARYQAEDEEEECPQTEDGDPVEKERGLVLTDAGMAALERWQDRLHGAEGALILWAREEMLPKHPEMVGVWWPELHSPEDLSCPRGGIFPERLGMMTVEMGWEPEVEEPSL